MRSPSPSCFRHACLRTAWPAVLWRVPLAVGPATAADGEAQRRALISTYERQALPLLKATCCSCHGQETQKRDIDFTAYGDGATAIGNLRLWQSCADKVAGHAMPPEKAVQQPTEAERALLVTWARGLKRLLPRDPGPGIIRRLSRREFRHAEVERADKTHGRPHGAGLPDRHHARGHAHPRARLWHRLPRTRHQGPPRTEPLDQAEGHQVRQARDDRPLQPRAVRLPREPPEEPEGPGTLLDHCIVMWDSGMGYGNYHLRNRLPTILAGKGGGTVRTGRYVQKANGNQGDLLTAILARAGVPVDKPIGYGTKLMADLSQGCRPVPTTVA